MLSAACQCRSAGHGEPGGPGRTATCGEPRRLHDRLSPAGPGTAGPIIGSSHDAGPRDAGTRGLPVALRLSQTPTSYWPGTVAQPGPWAHHAAIMP
jgi:hypothetical protein